MDVEEEVRVQRLDDETRRMGRIGVMMRETMMEGKKFGEVGGRR